MNKNKFTVEEIKSLVKDIMFRHDFKKREIAEKIGLSPAGLSRAMHGHLPISEIHFEKLKALAEGKLPDKNTENKSPPNQDIDALKKECSDLKERVAKLEGFIEGVKSQNFQKAEHKQQ